MLYVNSAESSHIHELNHLTAKKIISSAVSDGVDIREMAYSLMLENLRLHSVILDRENDIREMLVSQRELEKTKDKSLFFVII